MPLSIATPSCLNLHNIRLGDNWVFSFTAKQATEAELSLYTVQGQLAGSYTQHRVDAGEGEIRVEAANLKAGMYLWQLRVGAETTKGLAALAE
jgi:hypothetical protein